MVRGPIRLPRRVGPGGRTTEYSLNDWSPEEVERRIVGEAVEWLYVFDPFGRQVARFRGTPDEVDLSDELKRRTGGLYGEPLLKDHTLVHNHPPKIAGMSGVAAYPPSPTDLLTIVEVDVRELVVVSGDFRYSIKRPGDAWPTDEYEMDRLVNIASAQLDRELGPVGDGQGDVTRRLAAILVRLSEGGWIDYGWTETTSGL